MSLLAAETDFGLALLREAEQGGSFVFSPLSIALALSLVQVGAKGATKTQIGNALLRGASEEDVEKQYLNLSQALANPTNGVEVNLANRMYIRDDFQVRQAYLDAIKKNYEALAQNLNFDHQTESAKVMNDFIEEVTKGKIKDLVKSDSITPETVAFLVNALYIKADWLNQFYKEDTAEGDFFEAETKTRKVEYMNKYDELRDYAETDEVQVLSLKYKDESYAFNIFLPKEQFGLDKFRAELTGEKIQTMLGELKPIRVNVKIPKMKIESGVKLVPALRRLGISDLFEDWADLSGIADKIKISDVEHKAIIEVDEKGTTAAAATYAKVVFEMAVIGRKNTINFHADHPFFFALTKDKHPVFFGLHM